MSRNGSDPMTVELFAPQALLAGVWKEDVRLTVDDAGMIQAATPGASPGGATVLGGPVIPGMPDLRDLARSHAFQRAMAGLTERRGSGDDDNFWTWRNLMYAFQARLSPDDIHTIAAQLYIELLTNGYTAVGEFHYLHNKPDGSSYENQAELSIAVIDAARSVGISITHLPVLYAFSGFGDQPLDVAQRRFAGNADSILGIVDHLQSRYTDEPTVKIGVAPHSLRAVGGDMLNAVWAGIRAMADSIPVHIHIAEQTREVEDCLTWSGRRPVEWLYDTIDVDPQWCLVHATHLADSEIRAIAQSGAIVGLCPTTEANLGDGLFRLKDYAALGGGFGIGSDSNVSVSPVEELRWLEYGQRLSHRERNVFATQQAPDVGTALWRGAAAGGAQAMAQAIGALEVGRRADLVVLDANAVNLTGRAGNDLLNSLVFAGNRNLVRDVFVAGRQIISDGDHPLGRETELKYKGVLENILG